MSDCISLPERTEEEQKNYVLNSIDRKLILLTQEGLPLVPEPYRTLGEQLSISTGEVMARLECMLNNGVIRRIAAVPNHYKLGYRFNGMTVWDIADEQIKSKGQAVGQLSFVSHCYHRPRQLPDWPYNLFVMVHGRSQDEIEDHIANIITLLGDSCRQSDVLISSKILKKTGLRLQSA